MHKMKQFFSPARQARDVYDAGIKRGARHLSNAEIVALALLHISLWTCLGVFARSAYVSVSTEIVAPGGLTLFQMIYWTAAALAGGYFLREAIYVQILSSLIVRRAPVKG